MTHALAAVGAVAWFCFVVGVAMYAQKPRVLEKSLAVVFALLAGMTFFAPWLLDSTLWPARWECGNWEYGLGAAFIISDLMIFGAYMAFPVVGAAIAYRHRELLPPTGLVASILAFILWCGSGHFLDALMFVWPAYSLVVFTRIMTAIVSWVSVCMLYDARDFLSQYRDPETARRENARLLMEIMARETAVQAAEDSHRRRKAKEEEAERYRGYLESQNKQLGESTKKLREIIHSQEEELQGMRQRSAESGQAIAPVDLDHQMEQYRAMRAQLHDLANAWRAVPSASQQTVQPGSSDSTSFE